MTPLSRIVSKKINHSNWTHCLSYAGCSSTPKAWLVASSWVWHLYSIDGAPKGTYETLAEAKLRATEFGLL